MQNVYKDKETNLTIRRINYDSKDEVFADIRVIEWGANKSKNLPSIIPRKLDKFYEIGASHRGEYQNKIEIFAILNEKRIIATAGLILHRPKNKLYPKLMPTINVGVLPEYENRYADCVNALGKMLKLDFDSIYYAHPIGLDKRGIKLKKLIGYYPDEHQVEIWELNV